ncbi:D-methionine-binding lipoprotein MetQ precursor [Clostridium acetireducens DSM 10703]|jgi:D-methionine transport system substrate-binding protein|uniref:Lipoprotein n=1 Tax=Clostridium acetireducens DSM 10703 TaxID=1121290 RepID=A0A1E8EXR4_9CLOT|nr:MetQ/NlpA family ABC transporter substrate-binding protein [Clostridium acetireducens]OFI05301.1 D-methionine-binding lipoprotein MetQ precursor [Clostridium acetireducens DSM 10703]
MKKIISITLTLIFALAFIGCGGSDKKADNNKKEITIGITPVPFKEIVEKAQPELEKEGYKLKIVEFTDYVTPNTSLDDGEIDANLFQHVPYLNKFNEEKHTKLVPVANVVIAPMGVYSNKIKNLKDIKNNAEIAIPNDSTNGSRALKLLESAGLIKLKKGEIVTKFDIISNPKNIQIKELDAPQVVRVLDDVEAAIINTNFALDANLSPSKDSILLEGKDSPYVNALVVKEENKDKEYIKALSKALNSPEVKKFIEEKYKGNLIAAF